MATERVSAISTIVALRVGSFCWKQEYQKRLLNFLKKTAGLTSVRQKRNRGGVSYSKLRIVLQHLQWESKKEKLKGILFMSDSLGITDPNSGDFIIKHLKKWGSDVKQTHEFTFWLYFPTENLATKAGHYADSAGFTTDISPPLKTKPDSGWLCLLFLPHVPDERLLDGINKFCNELAEEFEGKFDGWETKMELQEGKISEGLSDLNNLKEMKDFFSKE